MLKTSAPGPNTKPGASGSPPVAGLVPDLVAATPDVPFLCDFRRATALVDSNPYAEIVRYLKTHRERVSAVFSTLAHFDGDKRAAAEILGISLNTLYNRLHVYEQEKAS